MFHHTEQGFIISNYSAQCQSLSIGRFLVQVDGPIDQGNEKDSADHVPDSDR